MESIKTQEINLLIENIRNEQKYKRKEKSAIFCDIEETQSSHLGVMYLAKMAIAS